MIYLPKAIIECSTPSIKSHNMGDEGYSRSLIQEHFEEISNKLIYVCVHRTSKSSLQEVLQVFFRIKFFNIKEK